MARVVLNELVKVYGSHVVVKGIDLEIGDGSFVALVGPSGCGKSTSLRMIAGLEAISHGTVQIGDRVVNDVPPRDRGIAMVFQSYALYPHMTVRENMGFALKVAGTPAREIDSRIERVAETLQLAPYLDRRTSSLSGGQQQRVAMGRAIIREPEVFLFDEPLSNLDAQLRAAMRIEIKRLHQSIGTTVVYVTHDQVEAMTMADIIVIMRDGLIEQAGPPLDVFEKPKTRFVGQFIGTPAMNIVRAKTVSGADGNPQLKLADSVHFPLPQKFVHAFQDGRTVDVGMRPEDIVPENCGVKPTNAVEYQGKIILTETLGSETFVLNHLDGNDLMSRVPGFRKFNSGDIVNFFLDVDRIHVFDGGTTNSLLDSAPKTQGEEQE